MRRAALLAALPLLLAAAPDDAGAIRRLREASNAGIAAHDPVAATRSMAPEVRVIASGGGLIDGAETMRSAFARTFADASFVTYRRTPRRIRVAGAVAAERGEWSGRWRDRQVTGEYLARWQRTAAGWRIVAEMYVPLDGAAPR